MSVSNYLFSRKVTNDTGNGLCSLIGTKSNQNNGLRRKVDTSWYGEKKENKRIHKNKGHVMLKSKNEEKYKHGLVENKKNSFL